MARPITPSVAPGDDIDPDGPIPVGMKLSRSGKLKRRNIIWRMRRFLVAFVAVLVLRLQRHRRLLLEQRGSARGLGRSARGQHPVRLDGREVRAPRQCFAELGKAEAGENVRFDQIPPVLVYALIAAEDKDFLRHQGIDPTGIARALWTDLRSKGAKAQGGSTLTQQLIKNMSDDEALTDRSVQRKVAEAVQAMKLERETSKEEIITRYLNSIYFGRWSQGISAAVQAYFGPSATVKQIDLPQAAYLAAVIREPEYVDAQRAPDRPAARQAAALRHRAAPGRAAGHGREGYISAEPSATGWPPWAGTTSSSGPGAPRAASSTPASRAPPTGATTSRSGSWSTRRSPKKQLDTEGLRIYHVDGSRAPARRLRRRGPGAVQDAAARRSGQPQRRQAPEAALASLDDQGFLRAMVGPATPSLA